jgi:hypothetical protein
VCEEAIRSDLRGTCTEAFKLLTEVRVAFDVSRLSLLCRSAELEKGNAMLHARLALAASLGEGGETLERDAQNLGKEDADIKAEQAALDALDARLVGVEEVVAATAQGVGLEFGAAREGDEVAAKVVVTARALMQCYEDTRRTADASACAGRRERLRSFMVRHVIVWRAVAGARRSFSLLRV